MKAMSEPLSPVDIAADPSLSPLSMEAEHGSSDESYYYVFASSSRLRRVVYHIHNINANSKLVPTPDN